MNRLRVGDRVAAICSRYVPHGTVGTVIQVDNTPIPYRVRYDGYGVRLWESADAIRLMEDRPMRKVGDRVRIKSREWYEANKGLDGSVDVRLRFTSSMAQFCGRTFEIGDIMDDVYRLKGIPFWTFSEEMFEDEVVDSTDTTVSFIGKIKGTITSAFTSDSKQSISVDLIRTNKLLTNIKVD